MAPLNWGLGHATRCIPIIKALLADGCQVYIAADGSVKALLQQAFPGLFFLSPPVYHIRYSRSEKWLIPVLLAQLPRLLYTIVREHYWLKKLIPLHGIDAVISDNRPGLWSRRVPSVYITHQLAVQAGSQWRNGLARRLHYFFINKFTACWVPDAAGDLNLAGNLSHPEKLPAVPVIYLGPLSRFERMAASTQKYDVLAIISGPEPQRSFFEALLLQQLRVFKGRVLLVQGLPGNPATEKKVAENVTLVNHLAANELSAVIQQSRCIICRSGYTTIMDLVALQQKAVLVPTPGQTEQVYLAEYLQQNGWFYTMKQAEFSLANALCAYEKYTPPALPVNTLLQQIIRDWL